VEVVKTTIRRKVQKIVDGDTFKVRNRVNGSQFIRIAGMDAPERGERGYMPAKRKLGRLKGKTVSLIPKGKSYGRTVAEVRHKRKKIR
jgi:endonuclease YncB( thermonuclease family)